MNKRTALCSLSGGDTSQGLGDTAPVQGTCSWGTARESPPGRKRPPTWPESCSGHCMGTRPACRVQLPRAGLHRRNSGQSWLRSPG